MGYKKYLNALAITRTADSSSFVIEIFATGGCPVGSLPKFQPKKSWYATVKNVASRNEWLVK